MNILQGLWIGKTGDANAWYHIHPFAMAENTKGMHVVRYKIPLKTSDNVKYHIFNGSGKISDIVTFFLSGFNVLRKNRIDYIVTFNPAPWGSVAWLLAKLFRKPLILGFIGADFNYYLKKSMFKSFYFFIAKHSSIITVTGNNMKEYFITKGIDEKKIRIFPHCVEKEWFDDSSKYEKKYDLITVSGLIKRKRIQDIIESVEILKSQGKNLKFCVLGEGPEKENLVSLVKQKKLEENIIFEGFQKDVKKYMLASKLYIQASYGEGFSLSLVEALTLGLVPIVTNAGSENDHIEEGKNGFFFEIGNTRMLADKIQHALNNKIYSNVQKDIMQNNYMFSEEYAIKEVEKILSKI